MAEKLAVIDFETTGIHSPEVLQTAIIDEYEFPVFYELSRPDRAKTWPEAERIHGITPAMVANRSMFQLFAPTVERLLNEANTVIAYNARYELSILQSYGIRLRHDFMIDPMLMFAPIAGEWNYYRGDYKWQKLTKAAAYYGYKFDAHDALADVKATLYIFRRMLAEGVPVVRVPTGAVAA